MAKRTTRYPWVVKCDFVGGPACGSSTEVGVEGLDPALAFIDALKSNAVPGKLQLKNGWYVADLMSLTNVSVEDTKFGKITYLYEGLRI